MSGSRYDPPPVDKPAGGKALPERCRGCLSCRPVTVGDGWELFYACVYALETGRRRPCPAGDECTVYRPQKKEDKHDAE